MDDIQKFFSDIQKQKKYYIAENNNVYDGEQFCSKIKDFFAKGNKELESLSYSFADYWFTTYIVPSSDIKNEPSNNNLDKLAALKSLLCQSTENTECLTQEDWQQLSSIVNAEAEDLPMNLLEFLMFTFVEKKAFND